MKTPLTQNIRKSGLEQGTITAINRLTGKISLFMKNGLKTTATYLYDVKDLRAGMSVLVGRVDNSFIVMNKMSNNPGLSTSITMPKIQNTLLSFDFEGVNGSLTWVEGVLGLTPSRSQGNCAIDTSMHYHGASSLKIPRYGISFYTFPEDTIPNNFICKGWFYAPAPVEGTSTEGDWNYISLVALHGTEYGRYPWIEMGVRGHHAAGLLFPEAYCDDPSIYRKLWYYPVDGIYFSYNTWHEFILTAKGKTISMKIDNIVYATATSNSGIDEPFAGITGIDIASSCGVSVYWKDKIRVLSNN